MTDPTLIQIDTISADGGTQSRERCNDATIAEYAEAMRQGDVFPPIILYEDEEGCLWLADGFHRFYASLQLELTEIEAEIRPGTRRDAILHSVGSNITHGLRRTNADKRRSVMILLRDGEWSRWSNRDIARRCGVSHTFVSNLRTELEQPTQASSSGPIQGAIQAANDLYDSAFEPLTPTPAPPHIVDTFSTIERDLYEAHLQGETVCLHMGDHKALMDWAKAQGVFVRVDRRSKWGNPHRMDEGTSRSEVIARFARDHLPTRPDLLAAIPTELKGKILGCWCAPWACHGETLAEIADGEMEIEPVDIDANTDAQEEPGGSSEDDGVESDGEAWARGVATATSSESNEWYTPEHIIEMARHVLDGIDLDPASCPLAQEVVRARRYYTADDDGLAQDWSGEKGMVSVWLNPPYGKDDKNQSNAGKWAQRLIQEYMGGTVECALLLVNAGIGRKWFRPLWDFPICFPHEKVAFYNEQGPQDQPLHGNAIVYMGDDVDAFVETFSAIGQVVVPEDGISVGVG